MRIKEELLYSIIGFVFTIVFILIFSVTNNWKLGIAISMLGVFSFGIFVVNLSIYLEKLWKKKKFAPEGGEE
ncbi:hypothetical protein LCGC14_1604030 [marine sediment metagenome]|uniref:Uncharacterized protein n=1 Tax=marine sediment metagenome TaxID=412755 RepID=A0A0F9IAD2_9ZZZZ